MLSKQMCGLPCEFLLYVKSVRLDPAVVTVCLEAFNSKGSKGKVGHLHKLCVK